MIPEKYPVFGINYCSTDYEKAAENNCYLKFDDGSECRFCDEDWPIATTTYYKHA